MPSYDDVVRKDWSETIDDVNHKLKKRPPFAAMDQIFFSSPKLHFHMASMIILCLDIAKGRRQLSPEEQDIHLSLKTHVIGLHPREIQEEAEISRG